MVTVYKGRRKITTSNTLDDMKDPFIVMETLKSALPNHEMNRTEIVYLINYRNGSQPILEKEKAIRPEINYQLVLNHAQMATRNIVGYFLGNPIQYISSGDSDKKKAIDDLNRYVQFEDKASVDTEIGEFQSICGIGHRIVYKDGIFKDEVPFEDKALDPRVTFVVYEESISEKPLMGVTYHNIYNLKGEYAGIKYYVYTPFAQIIIIADASGHFDETSIQSVINYDVGGVPIIEYPNNMWRVGDWELALNLMDAINALYSGRMDDVDQIVQSLIVFFNAELDPDRYQEMRLAGVVSLKNSTGNQAGVDTITNPLEQTGMNMLAEELENLLYAIIGIPNRNNRSGGGGDTGQAVELRDGWADLEIVARSKESIFKKSEKQALKIILSMFNADRQDKLSLLDIDIKFTRNKNNNLLVKAQSYQSLLATKTLSPADCLTIVDLVSDVNEFISRGEAFWGEEFGNKMQEVSKVDNKVQPLGE